MSIAQIKIGRKEGRNSQDHLLTLDFRTLDSNSDSDELFQPCKKILQHLNVLKIQTFLIKLFAESSMKILNRC